MPAKGLYITDSGEPELLRSKPILNKTVIQPNTVIKPKVIEPKVIEPTISQVIAANEEIHERQSITTVQEAVKVIDTPKPTEEVTAFKKTILGKILTGAAKVVLPVAAAITGVGAIAGVAKGIGAVAGVKSVVTGIAGVAKKGFDVVATKAADLVTGVNKEQRAILKAEKDEAQAAKDKLDFADKLMKAGASKAEAYQKAGIPLEEASGVVVQKSGITNYLLIGGGLLAAFLLLPKLFKSFKKHK